MERLTIEQIKDYGVWGRLSYARILMQEEGVKKEGLNAFQKYSYWKLDQINPVFNRCLFESRLCSHIHVSEQIAILTIKNIDNPDDEIVFSIPTVPSDMAKVSQIQARGSEITYFTRYLILQAMQIGEAEKDIDEYDQQNMNASFNKEGKGNKGVSLKEEVQLLCREKSKEKRVAVNDIIKKYNNGSISVAKVENEESLKKIKEEVEKL